MQTTSEIGPSQSVDAGTRQPDPRPGVRENAAQLGDLVNDFDVAQPSRLSVLLPPWPYPSATATATAG
jgi:hypothetical protein